MISLLKTTELSVVTGSGVCWCSRTCTKHLFILESGCATKCCTKPAVDYYTFDNKIEFCSPAAREALIAKAQLEANQAAERARLRSLSPPVVV